MHKAHRAAFAGRLYLESIGIDGHVVVALLELEVCLMICAII